MFFAPHLAQQAEEDAEEDQTPPTAPPPPPVAPTPAPAPAAAAAAAPESSSSLSRKEEDDATKKKSSSSKVVGTIERIQVELHAGAEAGGQESVALPDGRVVEFRVPTDAKAGDVVEIEVSRKKVNWAPITREVLLTFFQRGVEAMEASRSALVESTDLRPGPHLIEIQQREFDKLSVDRKAGCQAASSVDATADPELGTKQLEFMTTAQRSYLRALEDLKPKKFHTRRMTRAEILEFFDACNTKMALPETHAALKASALKTKKLPNELVVEMQKDMLETLGFERDFGCQCLNAISADFPNDSQLGNAMRLWAVTASTVCKDALSHVDPSLKSDSSEAKNFHAVQQRAAAELETMPSHDKDKLLASMSSKVKIFQNLDPAGRMRYVAKLPEKDKVDFLKAQILLVRQMHGFNNAFANMGLNSSSS